MESSITKVYNQVAHYFSDANLNWDGFMREKLALDDGWVDLRVLVTFNKLKQEVLEYMEENDIEADDSKVVETLNKILDEECKRHNTLELLVVDPETIKIRRTVPYTRNNAWFDKTVHLSFGRKETTRDILDLIKTKMGEYGRVDLIRTRKYFNKRGATRADRYVPKGKFLVEFSTPEEAQAAV
ncbi:Lupus La protein-like protein, partial [Smittium mucronatum]